MAQGDDIPLRQYVDQRFDAQDKTLLAALASAEKAVSAALAAADRAVMKAETAADKRFESVNEFRKTLSDQTATFIPRVEYDISSRAMMDKIEGVQKFVWVGLGAAAAIQFAIGIVLYLWKKQ